MGGGLQRRSQCNGGRIKIKLRRKLMTSSCSSYIEKTILNVPFPKDARLSTAIRPDIRGKYYNKI
jgi:hypothetical protein